MVWGAVNGQFFFSISMYTHRNDIGIIIIMCAEIVIKAKKMNGTNTKNIFTLLLPRYMIEPKNKNINAIARETSLATIPEVLIIKK